MRILLRIAFMMAVADSIFGDKIQKNDVPDEGIKAVQFSNGRVLKYAKIIGFYSVTTHFSLITRTTSSIWTCMSTLPSGNTILGMPPIPVSQCTGRRRRRTLDRVIREDFDENERQLLSSVNETPLLKSSSRAGKRITVWSEVYSTLDIIVTLPIPGSTVTVSALCNPIAGVLVPQGCFLG